MTTANTSQLIELGNSVKSNIIYEYKKRKGFTDDEKTVEGTITTCAGLVSLLLLKNGIGSNLKFENDEIEIIRKSINDVLSYVDNNGYDATPFLTSEKTKEYFKPTKGYYYYDTISWVLSLMIQVWNANKLEEGRLLSQKEIPKIKKTIKENLQIISSGMVPGGGWGFTNNCEQADLYYSYTISESLADFADYILGESLEEGIGDKDIEIINYLTQEIVDQIDDCRKATANWLVDSYIRHPKNKLGDVLINPDDPQGEKFKTLSDEKAFTLLYYTYFVIDMLIINKADEYFHDESKTITKAIEHGIYLTRIYFDKAKALKSWWESKDDSELIVSFQNNSKIVGAKNLSRSEIREPGLVPLSLRCNILYSFYISKGQDKKIDELFDVVINNRNNRHNEHQLWDTFGYNILVTERAVEGLIDYLDYKHYQDVSFIDSEQAPSSPSSALTASIDTMIRSYITMEVKEYFKTNSVTWDEPTKPTYHNDGLTKIKLVEVLSELFTDMELYIGPRRNDALDAKEISTIELFAKKYATWLQNILYIKLRQVDENGDKDYIIHDNLKKQDGVFNIISRELNEKNQNPNKFEAIISTLIEKYFTTK